MGLVEEMVDAVVAVVHDVVDLVAGIATVGVSYLVTTVARWDILLVTIGPREGAESKSGASTGSNEGSNSNLGGDISATKVLGVNDTSIRRLPRKNESRERTPPNGAVVKWCWSVDPGAITFVQGVGLGMRSLHYLVPDV